MYTILHKNTYTNVKLIGPDLLLKKREVLRDCKMGRARGLDYFDLADPALLHSRAEKTESVERNTRTRTCT